MDGLREQETELKIDGLREQEFESKRTFLAALCDTLKLDPRSGIADIQLVATRALEVVFISYKGGHLVKINATGNSNGANLEEIAREIYGAGAIGRMK